MGFLIYDVVIIAVLALFVALGWHRGLLLSLCGLAAAVVAFFGAGLVADTLSAPVADMIAPKLTATIEDRFALYDIGAEGVIDTLREENGLFAWAADAAEEALEEQEILPNVPEVISAIAQYTAQRIAHGVIFALSFLILYILLTIALHALDIVVKLPVLDFCNGLGGGVIGLVKGVLIVFVGAAALMASSYQPSPQALESSYILKFFVVYNPILTLFGG